jgi:hypothetical protein
MQTNRRSSLFATLAALLMLTPFCADDILMTDANAAHSAAAAKAGGKVAVDLRGANSRLQALPSMSNGDRTSSMRSPADTGADCVDY